MLATLAPTLPAGKEWAYEVKWDGYRTIAVKDGPRAALYSRNLKDFSKTYPSIASAVARLSVNSAVIDGEVVAIDEAGRPSFQALHHSEAHALVFYAFDLLYCDGRDLTREPWTARRDALAGLELMPPILRSDPLPGTPEQIEEAVRGLGLEGLVAKRTDSRYDPGRRSRAWIKVKFQQRQEFVVGGFTEDDRRVDALVVGYHDGRKLLFAAKVRAGMKPLLRRQLFDALAPLRRKRCPFVNLPETVSSHWGEGITADDMATITWLEPIMVVQVAFTEWTRDNHLRHAAFLGVRDDVAPRDVQRES